MKKSIYSILALAILLVSACSQEEIVDVSKGEGQPVTIKVELPSVDARAITGEIGIGKGSLINQLVFSMYEEDQRNSEPLITQFVSRENDGSFLVTVPMAKDMKYDFLFLAYNKENPAFVLHTSDAKANNLNELKLKTELSANQESYDAFIGRLDSKGIDATATTTVTLTRPFAQINAATTASDLDEVKALGTEVNASDFKIYDVPNTLNVFTGEVSGRVNLEFKKDTILTKYNATDYPRNEELVVGSDIYKYLAMAYVLADKRSNNYDADFKFYRSDNQTIRHLSVVNMPIQANYRTNVVGTFLTQQENYEIHIDEVFEKPANDVTGAKQIIDETDMKAAIEAATIGQTLKLIADITLSETLTVPADKIITLDLNGKILTVNAAESTYAINNLGTLILKDSFVGTRSAGNTGGSLTARGIYNGYGNGGENVATAKIIVENGTYHAVGTNGGAAIYNYGIAEIKGGDFTSIGGYSLNNQKDASMTISEGVTVNNGIYCSSATLVVNGGELKGNRSGCHVIYAWDSNLTINGGDFYNNNSGNATLMAAGTSAVTVNKGTFGIKDGRIPNNGNTFTSYLLDLCDSASMTLENGTFNGGFRIQAGTSLTINGGTFNDCTGSNYAVKGIATVKGGIYEDASAKNFADSYKAEGWEVVPNDHGTWTVKEKMPTIVTPENLSTTDFNAGGEYKLQGNFSTITQIDITPTEGVTTVIDASEAIFGAQIKINIPAVPNHADVVSRENGRKGNYTLTGFKQTTLGIGAYGTHIAVTSSTLNAINVYAANLSLDIHDNTIDSEYKMQPFISSGETGYAASLMMMAYDLKFDNNKVKNAIDHVVAVNGLVGTFDTDLSEINNPLWASHVVSFTGNEITGIGGSTKAERSGFKIWDDLTYAPNGDLTGFEALPEAGKTLKTTIEHSNPLNVFEKAENAINPYKFSFYNLRLESL